MEAATTVVYSPRKSQIIYHSQYVICMWMYSLLYVLLLLLLLFILLWLIKNDSLLAGYPRYCTVTTLPDGTTVLNGGRSRRGKPRGPPGSRELQTALKGCDDPMFLDFIRRCLEWDPVTRMTPNAALRHGWLRRRLPRPPPSGEKSAGGVTDSPSGTLTSMRSTTNSGTSRTSNSNNAKMNTIASIHSGGSGGPAAVTSAGGKHDLEANLHSRHNSTASTKLPQIPNTIS